MADAVRLWGTFAIATIALLQPWLIWLIRRHFWAGIIQFHASGRLEIGYSVFGPLVNLSGTFRARDRDIYVKSAALSIERSRDRATHTFGWHAFRPITFSLAKPEDTTLELAGGFMLMQKSPARMTVVYCDRATQLEMTAPAEELRDAWSKVLAEEQTRLLKEIEDPYQAYGMLQGRLPQIYEEFRTSPQHVDAFTKLERTFYWEAGDYTASLEIETLDPARSVKQSFVFSISKIESDLLRWNILSVLRAVCHQQVSFFNFAYSEIK